MRSETTARHAPYDFLRAASLAGLVLFFLALAVREIWAVDLWWQLRTGQWILENHAVPSHDTLSYTVADHAWIEMRWLYCVGAYLLWTAGGAALLVLAQAATLAAAFTALAWPFRRTASTVAGCTILALGILAASERFVVRPELVTYLLIPVFLDRLVEMRKGRDGGPVWLLPALQVLWTNTHTLFIFGPVLAWCFAVGDAVSHLWKRRENTRHATAGIVSLLFRPKLLQAAGLVTAACWINPYFHRGATFPILLFREIHAGSILGRTITEFRSPLALESWGWDVWSALALVALSAATFVVNWRRTDPVRLALWGAVVYLAAVSLRNLGLLGIVGVWASLGNLDECLPARGAAVARRFPAVRAAAHVVLGLLLAAGGWLFASGRIDQRLDCGPRFGLGIVECNTPAEATDFIVKSGASPQLFHAMSDGSYLTWAARDRFPVFVDGRLEVYGETFVEDYLNVARRDWDEFADRWKIETVMAHNEHLAPLIRKIRASPKWVLVHVDARDMVFVRDVPRHAELIRKYRIDPARPWTPRAPEPEETPKGWRQWIGTPPVPWHSVGMAQALLALGSEANSAAYLRRAAAAAPDNAGAQLALAQLSFQARDYALAAGLYRKAIGHLRPSATRWCELGQSLYLSGNAQGALDAFARAIEVDPAMYEPQYNTGVILLKRGDWAAARPHIEAALRARPGDEAAQRALRLAANGR